jgi:hypothetical protein
MQIIQRIYLFLLALLTSNKFENRRGSTMPIELRGNKPKPEKKKPPKNKETKKPAPKAPQE